MVKTILKYKHLILSYAYLKKNLLCLRLHPLNSDNLLMVTLAYGNPRVPNANCIPLAGTGARVAFARLHLGSARLRISFWIPTCWYGLALEV